MSEHNTATGAVFYKGPSRIDGKPIIGIVTFDSANPKTGNVLQTWILCENESPTSAAASGNDESICGNCPLRGIVANGKNENRACYVTLHQAPLSVWRTYQAGKYPPLGTEHVKEIGGRILRYGAYGDPTAIPRKAWRRLETWIKSTRKNPGYTHQFRKPIARHWKNRLMASVHDLEEAQRAQRNGWRTFRTLKTAADIADNEIFCPASPEGNYAATCEQCGACDGKRNANDGRKNIAIVAHGTRAKISNLIELT